ncbi:MAG: hypothetical protein P0Y55_06620 [Candidatus Cohnella colombiensis]|uniref:Uncharacterized protein n=1 Tax=Candidatus Cohnella colombiensis TaxID=3121368 RepID=A0AA95F2L8_9BACL|nr:MAG: hypothetical protein P0Y55_06620 [Cohnella sp.]
MNLADMLSYADITDLVQIAESYECEYKGHSKNMLIQSILSAVQYRKALESRVSEMSGNDLRFLNSLLFETQKSYSLEELKARALGGDTTPMMLQSVLTPQQSREVTPTAIKQKRSARNQATPKAVAPPTPEESARHAISRFKRFGWLFNGYSQHTRYLYQVPEDVKSQLRVVLEQRYQKQLIACEEPPVYRDERGLIQDDVTLMLRFVREHEPPLTSEGVMYKRQLGQLLDLLSVVESVPTRAGWRFGYGRHFQEYPDRFSLIYDFAYSQGYIKEQQDRLFLTPKGHEVAETQHYDDLPAIYRYWLRLYKMPIPNLMTLVQWTMRLSADWITVASLDLILHPIIRSYYYDSSRDILEKRVLTILMHLGVIRWGETAEGQSVIRRTPQGYALVNDAYRQQYID